MAGGRVNGASLGVALCAALIGSAVIIGATRSPLALGSVASRGFPPGTKTYIVAEACVSQTVTRNTFPGGAKTPKGAVQRFSDERQLKWRVDGWIKADPPDGVQAPGELTLMSTKLDATVTVRQGLDGTWTVTDVESCRPSGPTPTP
jgi:hypothetical protein